jgi:hypothetical protein
MENMPFVYCLKGRRFCLPFSYVLSNTYNLHHTHHIHHNMDTAGMAHILSKDNNN